MYNEEKEYILCAAIWVDDGVSYNHQPLSIDRGIVVSGYRHHNCLGIINEMGDMASYPRAEGFITSENRFLNREDAMVVAKESGQVEKNEALFSEHLY